MSKSSIEYAKLQNGIWEAVLYAPRRKTPPPLTALHLQTPLPGLEVSSGDTQEHWILRLPVPAHILSDGVQTVVIERKDTNEIVGSFALIAGEADSFDIRAEIDLLRAEIEVLKTVMRRSLRS